MQPRGQRYSARLGAGGGGGAVQEARAERQAVTAAATAGRAAARASAARRARAAARAEEVEDSPRVLRDKCRRLARAIRNAKHLVVYTGAGISTAADIPDYRGPRGVWTRLARGEAAPRVEVAQATPTLTHMALTALWARGHLKFLVSQNCDGLHLRAGLPRRALAELHGNMFCELCAACRTVYLRAFDTTERTRRHSHATRRLCHSCAGELRDSIVHFGERGRAAWPLNWAGALRHAARADVILCLGSSLKVLRRYSPLWSMARPAHRRPRLYIVNLQWTPKDSAAALKINARCDAVMAAVARRLRLRVPRYRLRDDPLLAHATPLAPAERHTTRRAPLAAPPPGPRWGPSSSEDSSLSSPSASDSEDERPLLQLARRVHPASPSHAPYHATTIASPALHAFQVRLAEGEAVVLLRAEHVLSPRLPPPGPPTCRAGRKPLSDLRKFRMWKHSEDEKHLEVNGHRNGEVKVEKLSVDHPPYPPGRVNGTAAVKRERDLPCEEKLKRDSDSEAEEERAARRIIRRAVLLCRHQLYPGLHTILAGPSPPPAPAPPPAPPPGQDAQCSWCWARHGARRCLWYPARGGARAWRRGAGRRRYLCACCGAGGGEEGSGGTQDEPGGDPDAPGWYGKGYRKARRRR